MVDSLAIIYAKHQIFVFLTTEIHRGMSQRTLRFLKLTKSNKMVVIPTGAMRSGEIYNRFSFAEHYVVLYCAAADSYRVCSK